MPHTPNPYNAPEVRRAIQQSNINANLISQSMSTIDNEIIVIDGRLTTLEAKGFISGLTATRIPYASSSTALVDSSNIRYDGTNVIIFGLKYPNSDGTAGYVLNTDGSSNLSWTAQSGGISGLTSGRIPYANSATTLTDSANIIYDGTNVILSGLKYPNTDGTAGYVLKTDGAGNLSWVVQGGGSSGTSYSATTDSNVVIGQPVYVNSTGHVDLSCANLTGAKTVSGLATTSVSSGATVSFDTDGKITQSDWTSVIGSTNLTPGSYYYLAEGSFIAVPSYSNPGGTGDRTALITVTLADFAFFGTKEALIGSAVTLFFGGSAVAGGSMKFDFGVGVKKVINEATWHQDYGASQGTWQWQGSNDNSTWIPIGSAFSVGDTATQVQTSLSGNVDGYRYYRLYGISGNSTFLRYVYSLEFKIDNYGVHGVGTLTSTPPTSAGSTIIRVGQAISTTIMDIEIQPSILL